MTNTTNAEYQKVVSNESIEVGDIDGGLRVHPHADPPTMIERTDHESTTSNETANNNTNNSDDGVDRRATDFYVFRPALKRSESFIRRRIQNRKTQEQRLEMKHGKRVNDNKKTSNPIDLDEVMDEEQEAMRRNSNHGTFGILPSSLVLSKSCSCRPYRRDQLVKEIDDANQQGYSAVLKTLRDAGILVYIIDSKICITLHEIVDSVHKVIDNVCRDPEYQDHPKNQKCLLYRDVDGRLFNLTLTSDYSSLEGTWRDVLQSFSILQAMVLLTFLTRSFSCAMDINGDDLEDFRPAYLALVLGLVFSEETSLSWTNVAVLVRGMPSISAYSLKSKVDSDWLRKLLILLLAIASYTTSTFQKVCTLGGVTLTCLVVLANLGSRSWKYLHWKPTMGMKPWCCGLSTPLDPVMSYAAAILTGLCFPYLGHRHIESGGTAAIEFVLRIAIIVASLFVLSDYDEIQKFMVVGSEGCNQDYVNFGVGTWWTLSLIASLTILYKRDLRKGNNKFNCVFPADEEPLLQEDQLSPVGYKVPHLPDFPIDPSLTHTGWGPFCCFSVGFEYALGISVALTVGAFICYLGLTDLDDEILNRAFEWRNVTEFET
jgi:hypothetical protein